MIVVATPTRDSITAGTTGDLFALARRRPDAKFCAPLGIYIAALRNQAVDAAMAAGASHLLFIDGDMRFPDDTIDRLLAVETPIVAANYVQRSFPEWCVARVGGVPVMSARRCGVERVDSVGCGVMLIEMGVFQRLPRPWFDTPYTGKVFTGEDVYFCEHARAHGESIYIDHELSQHVRHQGAVEYRVQDVPEFAPR